jgi:hypothetical protein
MYFINHTRRHIVRIESEGIFFTIRELIDRLGWSLKDSVDLVMELDSEFIHKNGYRFDPHIY